MGLGRLAGLMIARLASPLPLHESIAIAGTIEAVHRGDFVHMFVTHRDHSQVTPDWPKGASLWWRCLNAMFSSRARCFAA